LTAFPAIESKRVPAALAVSLVPAAESIVVQVQKLCNELTGVHIIHQQERICPTRNAKIFALTTLADLKLNRSAEERKPGRIMCFPESFSNQTSTCQNSDPQQRGGS